MNFKPVSLFVLSLLLASTMAQLTSQQESLAHALTGIQNILLVGKDGSDTPKYLLPKSVGDHDVNIAVHARTLYEELYPIVQIYEAQNKVAQSVPSIQVVLQALVTDACNLINSKVIPDVACSSYDDVRLMKTRLELYIRAVDLFNELQQVHPGFPNNEPIDFYRTIPCDRIDADGTKYPNPIILSVNPHIGQDCV